MATTLNFPKLLLLLLVATCCVVAQTSSTEWKVSKPGVKEVQVPFAFIKPSATIKVGRTADWVLVTGDAVWVASTKPYAVRRDPATNRIVVGRGSDSLRYGHNSIWLTDYYRGLLWQIAADEVLNH